MAKLNAANQIIEALQTQVTTLQARVAELERRPKLSGSGTSRPATCDEMEARVEALREFRRKGHGCSVARAAGYSCVEARAVGYSLQEATGYSISEARAAGYSLQDIKAAGYSCSKAKRRRATRSRRRRRWATPYSCSDAKEAGYSLKETKAAGFSCGEAKPAGYTPFECSDAGYSYEKGRVAGYPFEHNAWTLPRYNQSIPPSQPVGMTLKFAGYHMSQFALLEWCINLGFGERREGLFNEGLGARGRTRSHRVIWRRMRIHGRSPRHAKEARW